MKTKRFNIKHGPRGGQLPERREPDADLRPGAHVGGVTLEWYGRQFVMRFRVPGDTTVRRARSDQIAVERDGEWQVMSLRAALLALEQDAPRVLTRKERGGT